MHIRMSLPLITAICISLSGCMPGTFEYYAEKDCPVFGHRSQPYFLSKDDVEILYDYGRIDLAYTKTYRDALEKIAETTSVPIVVTGDDTFLDKSIELKDRRERSISIIIEELLEPIGRTASIKRGWVKIK